MTIEEARPPPKFRRRKRRKRGAMANDIVTKARQASEAELVCMKAELRKEVGRLVVATSAKVTGGILTAEQQRGWRKTQQAARGRLIFSESRNENFKQARRDGKALFNTCKVSGVLDENRVRQTVTAVIARSRVVLSASCRTSSGS